MTPREFWTPIVEHPSVEPYSLCGMATIEDFLWWLDLPEVHEERGDMGGLVFVDKGSFHELHAAFLPEAWGRKVAESIRPMIARKMLEIEEIQLGEQEGVWRTRPPLSHGWKPVGEYEESALPRRLKRWRLTRDAWYSSPVGRKFR